jgi:hypothetical protein
MMDKEDENLLYFTFFIPYKVKSFYYVLEFVYMRKISNAGNYLRHGKKLATRHTFDQMKQIINTYECPKW